MNISKNHLSLLITILLVLFLSSAVLAATNSTVFMKDGKVYKQVTVKYLKKTDQLYITDYYPPTKIDAKQVEKILNSKGVDITGLVIDNNKREVAKQKKITKKRKAETKKAFKEKKKKIWNFIFGITGGSGASISRKYNNWDIGIGLGTNFRIAISRKFAVRINWEKNGLNKKIYNEYRDVDPNNNDVYFYTSELDASVGKVTIGLEFYKLDKPISKAQYNFDIGFGVLYEVYKFNRTNSRNGIEYINQSITQTSEYFVATLGAGFIRKISSRFGLSFDTNFEFISVDGSNYTSDGFFKNFEYAVSANVGLVYFIKLK